MITFTLIFFVSVVVVGIVVIAGFAVYLKRKTKKLRDKNHRKANESMHRNLSD